MTALFKFRCFQCEKLLGAPLSRVGSAVRCPRCGVGLIVPTPPDHEPPADEAVADAVRFEDLGLRLEPETVPELEPEPELDPYATNLMAYLKEVAETRTEPVPEPPPDPPASEADKPPDLPEPPDQLDTPLVPRARRRRQSHPSEPASRRRDVTLPQTAVVAWAMFALLSLGFAFAAGMLIGHFLWR